MNENYFNGKYNIIKSDMTFKDEVFRIRKQELDNDEVFSGNLILNKEFKNLDYEKIYSLPLDDKSIYVKDFENSPHANQCSVDDSIMYCGSFVLWLLGNFDRNDYSLYANLRRHRIVLRRITEEVLK